MYTQDRRGNNNLNKTKFYTKRKNIILLAIFCCFLWGSAYPSIKTGYLLFNINEHNTPSKLIFAGFRFALAGIIVLALKLISKKKIFCLSKEQFFQVTILGLTLTTLQYIFFYIGLSNTTGIRGSIINGTGAFVSIIFAHFIYKNDKLSFNKIIGCVIGFLGIVIVNLNGQSLGGKSFSLGGEGFIMIAAIISSAATIYSKKITQKQDATIVTGFQLLIGGTILTILGFITGGRLEGLTLKSISLLIYMALLSATAFSIWIQLLKYNKVGTIAVFKFLVPIFGTLLSAIFLGESIFNIKILVSLLLVCFGIFLVYKVNEENKS